MVVWSVFRRTKRGDAGRDGNPLIHALKRAQGYSIGYSSLKELRGPFGTILASIVATLAPEVLVPIPSGASINGVLSRRIAKVVPALTVECFEKLRIVDALAKAPSPDKVHDGHRDAYTTALHELQKSPDPRRLIEMKGIRPAKVRMYFQPIGFRAGAWGDSINGKRVVLVEDILSTGTTLLCAERLLLGRYQPASLSVITLLSGL